MKQRMSGSLLLLPAFLGGIGSMSGCSVTTAMKDHFSSSTETVPGSPKRLDASPETTGLLLVSASLQGRNVLQRYDYDLDAASIVGAASPNDVIQIRPFEDDLVVFQGLTPGAYTLVRLSGSAMIGDSREYAKVPLPADPGATVTVAAGEARYVGHLTYRQEGRTGGEWVAEWDGSAAREVDAWSALAKKYADSIWSPMIQQKLDEAQDRASALPAPSEG